jgi:hypothetical protein
MMRASLTITALVAASTLNAQAHDHSSHSIVARSSSVEHLLAAARQATEPYTDRNVAIAAGYRRVGRDFPSMGEHWLNPRLIVDGAFDVSKPQLLTYVKIAGRPVLTGVVYAIPLKQGESPPDAFGPEASWHEHNGSIDEEGLLPEHHSAPSAKVGTRVAFVHAWLRVPGSEPIFAAENWAIPFMRLELPVPDDFPNGAARALSLMSGGRAFLVELIGPAALGSVESFDECANTVAGIVRRAKLEERALDAVELQQLDEAWKRLVRNVASRSGIESARRINGGMVP